MPNENFNLYSISNWSGKQLVGELSMEKAPKIKTAVLQPIQHPRSYQERPSVIRQFNITIMESIHTANLHST